MSIHKQEYQFITTPHNVRKRFQNKKDMNVFEKGRTKDYVSSSVAPKESQNTYASTWKICVELDRAVEPHFREM